MTVLLTLDDEQEFKVSFDIMTFYYDSEVLFFEDYSSHKLTSVPFSIIKSIKAI